MLFGQVAMHACTRSYREYARLGYCVSVRVCVSVCAAAADRSSNTDKTQTVPMRPCMLTAAGQEEEQLLMGFQ